MNHYCYKLIPPRPTFAEDMTPSEVAAMEKHFAFWHDLVDNGEALVYGPVADPAGTYGLAVLHVESEERLADIARNDPAVTDGGCTSETYGMPSTIVAGALAQPPT